MTSENEPLPSVVSPPTGDGFDAVNEGNASIIKGQKAKFSNAAVWFTGVDEVIKPTREFIPVEHKRFVQQWGTQEGAPPLSTRELAPEEFFPDVECMNEEAPKSEWREAFGRKVGPWERVHALYLLEPATMAGFTYLTSTAGGFIAVRELQEAINRARMLGDKHLYPVVTLGDAFMNTKFGGRQRPSFKIVRWVPIGRPAAKPAIAAVKAKANADMDDNIPF